MNITEAKDYVRYYLRDPDARVWNDTLIEYVINECLAEHFAGDKFHKIIFHSDFRADNQYELPATAYTIEGVIVNGAFLDRVSPAQASYAFRSAGKIGTPKTYVITQREAKIFSIYPHPNASSSSAVFSVVDSIPKGASGVFALCSRSTPDISDLPYFRACTVLFLALSKLYLFEQGGKIPSLASFYRRKYELFLELERQWKAKISKHLNHQVVYSEHL